MLRSAETNKLDAALLAVQTECPVIEKSAENPFYHSKYAPYDGIIKIARPYLTKNGLIIEHSPSIDYKELEAAVVYKSDRDSNGNTEVISIAIVSVVTRITHAESGQWKEQDLTLPCEKVNAHGVQATLSYAKRNNLILMLDIAVGEEDDDGNDSVRQPEERVNRPVQRPVTTRPPVQATRAPAPVQAPVRNLSNVTPGELEPQPGDLPFDKNEQEAPWNDGQAAPGPAPVVQSNPDTVRPMSDLERARLKLISKSQVEAVAGELNKLKIKPDVFKTWLLATYKIPKLTLVTGGMYQGILDTVKKHPDIITNYVGGQK